MKKKKFYFISDNDSLVYLHPRIPNNFFTKNGYEDNITKRVCLSESVSGALSALSQNLQNKVLTVYEVYLASYYKPSITEVPDCKVTQEVWSLNPVKLHKIYKIKITSAVDNPLIFYYGNKCAETYRWNYIKINKNRTVTKF